jgi:hypothetical protein
MTRTTKPKDPTYLTFNLSSRAKGRGAEVEVQLILLCDANNISQP